MNFSNISNSKKIELLKLKLSSTEELLFEAIITAGFLPEEFNHKTFEDVFASLDDEEVNIGDHATYSALNKTLQIYLKLKNSIELLEKEENGI